MRQLRTTCVSRDAALRAISQPELPSLLPAMDGRAMHLARVFHGRRAIMAQLCLSFPTSRFPLLPTQRSLSFLNPCALDKSLIREELQNKHTISTICRNSSDVLHTPTPSPDLINGIHLRLSMYFLRPGKCDLLC